MKIVGIDLGTSNSALAYVENNESLVSFELAQLDSPGMIGRHTSLPSVLYLPRQNEVTPDECRLPWQTGGETNAVVGRWARDRGSEAPDRVIQSAKSWLCHKSINRDDACLPWQSDIEGKLSPIDVSAKFLAHLWQAHCFEHQAQPDHVIITVPASFDEVARTLTQKAAMQAGIPESKLTLLEEPQAALYSWIDAHSQNWRESLDPGDVILVCDVGGGTTDFSLIAVSEKDSELALDRIAVGEHLLLGGDNMDLSLAYGVRAKLEEGGVELDHWQFLSLVASTRLAKESLLSDLTVSAVPIAIASRGASLFAQTIATELTREMVEATIIEGFFPMATLSESLSSVQTAGFQEFGLHYEAEPSIVKHLAKFLKRAAQNIDSDEQLSATYSKLVEGGALRPSKVLFNGGVFKASILRDRILEVIASWGTPVVALNSMELDLACARGAAYYGQIKASGKGLRIRSGTARSYYLGVEVSMPAVPGVKPPVHGICVVPQGTEEGSQLSLLEQNFGLVVGQPVRFRFFSSPIRAGDILGQTVKHADRELEETESLAVTLPAGEGQSGELIPVKLQAAVTETGVLQLSMHHALDQRKWNLEFNVRGNLN